MPDHGSLKGRGIRQAAATPRPALRPAATALTSRSDMGVLSPSGRCCSSASTIQLAMMVARIMYSNGVRGLRTGQEAPKRRGEETKADSAQCSSRGQAASGGAENDRVRSPPRPSRPHPRGRREGRLRSRGHQPLSTSPRPSAPRTAPPPRLRPTPAPRGRGLWAPSARLEEGPRAGAHSHLKTHAATCTYTGT